MGQHDLEPGDSWVTLDEAHRRFEIHRVQFSSLLAQGALKTADLPPDATFVISEQSLRTHFAARTQAQSLVSNVGANVVASTVSSVLGFAGGTLLHESRQRRTDEATPLQELAWLFEGSEIAVLQLRPRTRDFFERLLSPDPDLHWRRLLVKMPVIGGAIRDELTRWCQGPVHVSIADVEVVMTNYLRALEKCDEFPGRQLDQCMARHFDCLPMPRPEDDADKEIVEPTFDPALEDAWDDIVHNPQVLLIISGELTLADGHRRLELDRSAYEAKRFMRSLEAE